MLKRGTTAKFDRDDNGAEFLHLAKKRGKFTLDEIYDAVRYGRTTNGGREMFGHYAIILNLTEDTCGGNGLWLMDDNKGDSVDLHLLESDCDCPACGHMMPPKEYCPNCGERWDDENPGPKDVQEAGSNFTRALCKLVAMANNENMGKQITAYEPRQELYTKDEATITSLHNALTILGVKHSLHPPGEQCSEWKLAINCGTMLPQNTVQEGGQ